jgi:hypothetical protein
MQVSHKIKRRCIIRCFDRKGLFINFGQFEMSWKLLLELKRAFMKLDSRRQSDYIWDLLKPEMIHPALSEAGIKIKQELVDYYILHTNPNGN